jgi:hypothetical protein
VKVNGIQLRRNSLLQNLVVCDNIPKQMIAHTIPAAFGYFESNIVQYMQDKRKASRTIPDINRSFFKNTPKSVAFLPDFSEDLEIFIFLNSLPRRNKIKFNFITSFQPHDF